MRHEKDQIIWETSYRSRTNEDPDMELEIKEPTLYGDKKISFPLSFDRKEYELLAEKLVKLEKVSN